MKETGRGTTKSTQKSWTKRKKVLPWCQLAGGMALAAVPVGLRTPLSVPDGCLSQSPLAWQQAELVSAYFRRWWHLRVGHFGRMISTLTPTLLCPSASGPPWSVDEADRLPSGVSSKA